MVCCVVLTLFELPVELVTVTATGPVPASAGESTLSYVGLT